MPPKKNKQANKKKLKLGRQAKLEKEAVAESDTALNNLQSSFKESKAYMIQLTLSKVWSGGRTCMRKSQPNLNQINIALVKSLIFIFEDFSPEQY